MFCLSTDLVCRQMLMRIVPLKTYSTEQTKSWAKMVKRSRQERAYAAVRRETHHVKSEQTLENCIFLFACIVMSPMQMLPVWLRRQRRPRAAGVLGRLCAWKAHTE